MSAVVAGAWKHGVSLVPIFLVGVLPRRGVSEIRASESGSVAATIGLERSCVYRCVSVSCELVVEGIYSIDDSGLRCCYRAYLGRDGDSGASGLALLRSFLTSTRAVPFRRTVRRERENRLMVAVDRICEGRLRGEEIQRRWAGW